jgi:hypothetical protein
MTVDLINHICDRTRDAFHAISLKAVSTVVRVFVSKIIKVNRIGWEGHIVAGYSGESTLYFSMLTLEDVAALRAFSIALTTGLAENMGIISMATIQQQKIRIQREAYDRRLLDTSCDKIVETTNHFHATAVGPIPNTHSPSYLLRLTILR